MGWTLLGAGLLLALYTLLRHGLRRSPPLRDRPELRGRTAIVTGGSSGIGAATALELARCGARVVLATRNAPRGEAAARRIRTETGNEEVLFMQLDLASLRSVRAFATAFLRQEPHLHLLINNAGVSAGGTTEDGFSLPFQVNHLGHFLLTQLLLERLQSCAPSRVVIVASRAHCAGRLRPDTLGRPPSGLFSAFQDYCDSKLANVLHARELATRLQGTQVTCYAVHPGRDPALQPRAGDGGTGVGSVSPFAWGVLCTGCPFMQGGLCVVQALHRTAFARCAFCTVQPLHREFLHVEHPLSQSILCVASPFARSKAQPLHGIPLRDALFASALFARNIPLRGVSLCRSIPSHSVPVHIVSLCTKRPFAQHTLAQSILFLHGAPCTEPCATITRPDGARAASPGKAVAKLSMQRPPWRGRFPFLAAEPAPAWALPCREPGCATAASPRPRVRQHGALPPHAALAEAALLAAGLALLPRRGRRRPDLPPLRHTGGPRAFQRTLLRRLPSAGTVAAGPR